MMQSDSRKINEKTMNVESSMKLFAGEKLLVITGLIGFLLAMGTALFIAMNGAIRPPEGNLWNVFSFDAAIGLFILSIAAILPVSGLSSRKRAAVRWFFIPATLYAYAVETIQHFRGINPRFTEVGSGMDQIFNALFGLDSILIIIVTILLAIPFFRKKLPHERPLLVLGIRYAFISIILAYAAGLWMIALQSRFIGEDGNLIILHGIGFHALQALPLLGWLSERMNIDERLARRRIHIGSLAWTVSILLIGLQTVFGKSVFELMLLPLLAGVMLLVSLVVAIITIMCNAPHCQDTK